MENELFNICLGQNEYTSGLVLGSFTFDELREELDNVFDNILPKCTNPAEALDGLEIVLVRERTPKDAEK